MARSKYLIAAFVALQLGVPLSYYMARDPRDERFAWRMFSATRFELCNVTLTALSGDTAPRLLDPLAEMHAAWYAMLRRGRGDVARAHLASRCREHPHEQNQLALSCAEPQATTTLIYRYDCASQHAESVSEQRPP